jgi:hypothetical protein
MPLLDCHWSLHYSPCVDHGSATVTVTSGEQSLRSGSSGRRSLLPVPPITPPRSTLTSVEEAREKLERRRALRRQRKFEQNVPSYLERAASSMGRQVVLSKDTGPSLHRRRPSPLESRRTSSLRNQEV